MTMMSEYSNLNFNSLKNLFNSLPFREENDIDDSKTENLVDIKDEIKLDKNNEDDTPSKLTRHTNTLVEPIEDTASNKSQIDDKPEGEGEGDDKNSKRKGPSRLFSADDKTIKCRN